MARRVLLGAGDEAQDVFMSFVAPAMGTLMANAMFLAPLQAVRAAELRGVLAPLNTWPYPIIVANCLTWLAYSVVIRDWWLYWGNLPGAVLGLYFVLAVLPLAPPPVRRQLVALTLGGFGLVGIVCVGVAGLITRDSDATQWVLGLKGNAILLAFYAAPLATIREVLLTRDASSIDPPVACANSLNGVCWCAYGLALGDWFLAAPNAIGASLGFVQLLLLVVFRRKPSAQHQHQLKKSGSEVELSDALAKDAADVP